MVGVTGVLPARLLPAVVEDRLAVHDQLDLAVDAADHAQQDVVGVVVGRCAAVGARAVLLVVPRSDQQDLADDDPAVARAPAGLEDHGPGQVTAVGRHVDVGGSDPEVAGAAVEDRAEDAGRVEPRQAEPLDAATGRATTLEPGMAHGVK